MTMNIVRQSKFRHVFCKPVKHEDCMSDIRITEITWDSLFCSVNPKFIAIINKGSGGPFLVIPVNKVGRISQEIPYVDAHKAPCLEVQWSPFNDHVIASCSEDTTAKVWLIPKGGLVRTLTEPVVELSGHQKRVNTIQWHPTANNILFTAGGENVILVWNVGTGEALMEVAGHPDQIWSIAFNYDGSRFVTTCKDRKIRVLDSHSGAVLHEGVGHEGIRPQRAIFVQGDRIFTTGFTKRSERLYALRSQENLSTPIVEEEIDTSNGVLFPLYDEDSSLIFLAGKGGSAIQYYEINDEAPYVHYINTYTTNEPQRGVGFMPKRGLNHVENEISRIYKVTTKGIVDILQFYVPRKSELWQADLYPDTRSTEPSLSAEEFAEGKNAAPKLVPVNAAAAEAKPRIQVAKKANILNQLPPTTQETPTEAPVRQRPAPRIEEDMGIVRTSQAAEQPRARQSPPQQRQRSESPPNAMVPKRAVQLRPREQRDEGTGPQSAGQKRAAAELDRIRREQNRNASEVAEEQTRQQVSSSSSRPASATPSARRNSNTSTTTTNPDGEALSMDDLLGTIERMKAVLRQHERRLRMVEELLAEQNMSQAYGF
ncbi:Coronin [Aphelenchoides besseyi]|nr:Coronin [Aphelenchoides besseyi]